ncbi:TPA: hypothetical protein ACXM51_001202 [Stenotrophomonas maltophilia]
MNLDLSKWSLLEKLSDFPFVLRMSAFALASDFASAMIWHKSIVELSLRELTERPGLALVLIVIFGPAISVGAVMVQIVVQFGLIPIALAIQERLPVDERDDSSPPMGYVTQFQAMKHLMVHPDHQWLARLEACLAKHREEERAWLVTVRNSIACMALSAASWCWADQSLLSVWADRWIWTYLVVLLLLGTPLMLFIWRGFDSEPLMYWPDLYDVLRAKREENTRKPAFVSRASSRR